MTSKEIAIRQMELQKELSDLDVKLQKIHLES
jgi:hypothetical protein